MREVVNGGYGAAHSALVFMVESKEQVHMVNLLFDGSFSNVVYEVSVYRMDFASQEWRRVHDLGGEAFLLSAARFGASRPAGECGLEEDCVYVAYPWDKGLMIYLQHKRGNHEGCLLWLAMQLCMARSCIPCTACTALETDKPTVCTYG